MKTRAERIREWVACPQFGDDYYGELGAIPFNKRKEIKFLCDYVTSLEAHDNEMTKKVLSFKDIIKDKIDEILEEYNVILKSEHSLDYINTVTAQRNAMRTVLEELLEELDNEKMLYNN